MLKSMVVGWGGRAEALEAALRHSPLVSSVLVADDPGNNRQLIELAKKHGVSFVVIGPEEPLVRGVVDDFASALPAVKVFGPTRLAAELEGSKIYMKTRCERFGIPTARFDFAGSYQVAERSIRKNGWRVIKVDGLHGGKGVEVVDTEEAALEAAAKILATEKRVLLEEKLVGEELSVMALCDGKNAVLLEPARDQKRLSAGTDVMTGGMGAFSPVPGVTTEMLLQIEIEIIYPLLQGMAREKRSYHGVLYAGIMLTQDGPKLLEVNCRFGDPEAQVVLARLDCDLVPSLLACLTSGGLEEEELPRWKSSAAVCFYGVSKGYPATGHREISILGEGQTLAAAREDGLRQLKMHHQVFREDIAAGL